MNIGIVVYSWSGNTLSVAEKLRDRLASSGHTAHLVQVKVVGERKQGARDFKLDALPDLSSYDALVFGAAVEAFSLSPVLTAYLKKVESLAGKRVACLATQQFPYPWMGGSNAIRQMRGLCRAKGASVVGSAVVNWAKSRRDKTMTAAIDRLSGLF
ncbi:flavodoxin [Candidatus Bipolaricaulota bacterium]|nr:flavodoxin [Candidatus Bipolaricaulota bacterium]